MCGFEERPGEVGLAWWMDRGRHDEGVPAVNRGKRHEVAYSGADICTRKALLSATRCACLPGCLQQQQRACLHKPQCCLRPAPSTASQQRHSITVGRSGVRGVTIQHSSSRLANLSPSPASPAGSVVTITAEEACHYHDAIHDRTGMLPVAFSGLTGRLSVRQHRQHRTTGDPFSLHWRLPRPAQP